MMPYEEMPGVNWSSLKHLTVSALLYRWRMDHPEPRKPAFVLGGAVHCAVLEPETFDQRYAVFDGTRRGEDWNDWREEHPGVESLKPREMERVRTIAEAMRRHRVATEILRGGRREEVVTWTDQETGLACKGRMDYIRPVFVAELKTARNPSPRKFERAAFDYGYQGQTAFYHDGAVTARLTSGDERPYIVAAQSVEPYDVAVFQLDPLALAAGRALYRMLLKRLALYTESDFWPGVAPDLLPLSIPPWGESIEVNENDEEF